MISYLANYLPWRRCPLLGTWEVDVDATEQRLKQQLPDKSKIQSKLQSITGDRWVFTMTYSTRNPRDFGSDDPQLESTRRYRWKLDGNEGLYISEAREDGNDMLFKLGLIDEHRFEFFEPLRGYTVVWRRI